MLLCNSKNKASTGGLHCLARFQPFEGSLLDRSITLGERVSQMKCIFCCDYVRNSNDYVELLPSESELGCPRE